MEADKLVGLALIFTGLIIHIINSIAPYRREIFDSKVDDEHRSYSGGNGWLLIIFGLIVGAIFRIF